MTRCESVLSPPLFSSQRGSRCRPHPPPTLTMPSASTTPNRRWRRIGMPATDPVGTVHASSQVRPGEAVVSAMMMGWRVCVCVCVSELRARREGMRKMLPATLQCVFFVYRPEKQRLFFFPLAPHTRAHRMRRSRSRSPPRRDGGRAGRREVRLGGREGDTFLLLVWHRVVVPAPRSPRCRAACVCACELHTLCRQRATPVAGDGVANAQLTSPPLCPSHTLHSPSLSNNCSAKSVNRRKPCPSPSS